MGLGSIFGGIAGGLLQSIQNPLNSAFGSVTGGFFPAGINQFGDNFLNGWMNYYWNKKAADDANNRMVSFWNMQNLYNSPKEQMKRYAEAGLNPNLIYGQSNVAGAIGRPAVASFSMPSNQVNSRGFDILQALQAYYGLQNVRAQNSLISSQADVAKEQARKLSLDNDYLERNGLSSLSPGVSKYVSAGFDALFNSVADFLHWYNRGSQGYSVRTVYDRGF